VALDLPTVGSFKLNLCTEAGLWTINLKKRYLAEDLFQRQAQAELPLERECFSVSLIPFGQKMPKRIPK
jgi:hypothetical protein